MDNTLHVKLGLKRVINASGRMSILGVSAPSERVFQAMSSGGKQYVEMADLVDKAGAYVAEKLGTEAGLIVNSASSGIVMCVAALVTAGNRRLSMRLHQEPILKNEIILFKGHNVQYGAPIETMVYLGGGKAVEVGYANEGRASHIEEAVSERTAAILYVKSHHAVQKNTLSLAEAAEVAQSCQIPLIVDAAAEEDLQEVALYGDLVIFSGSKAIEGPTSGLVVGKRQYIDWVKQQLEGIGRSMKVGKEAVFGTLQALEDYADMPDRSAQEKAALQTLEMLNELAGLHVSIVQDEAGRSIFRARMRIDEEAAGRTAKEVAAWLREGRIAIYTRDYGVSEGFFDLDARSLQGDDLQVIEQRIREIWKGKAE